jgi:hypothetical protein
MPKGQRSSKETKKPKKDAGSGKGVSLPGDRPSAPPMPELVKRKKPVP